MLGCCLNGFPRREKFNRVVAFALDGLQDFLEFNHAGRFIERPNSVARPDLLNRNLPALGIDECACRKTGEDTNLAGFQGDVVFFDG